jgi:hypothetical protein
MPCAGPTLRLVTLPLPAVAGAAITTGITTPVTPSGPPPQSSGLSQGTLGARGCAGTTTARPVLGKPSGRPGVTARPLPQHFAPEQSAGEQWRRSDPEGGRPCDLRGSLPPARGGASTTSFGFRLLIAATLARSGWLDPLRAHRDLPCEKHQVSLAHQRQAHQPRAVTRLFLILCKKVANRKTSTSTCSLFHCNCQATSFDCAARTLSGTQ